jgi:MFS family permease
MYRPVVSATIADVVSVDDRPRAYGLMYWAVNLGASIAPILGGVIAASSYRALFVADAATTALYGVIVLAALPETRPPPHVRPDGAPGAARAIIGDPVLLAVCGLTFAFSIAFFQSFVALPMDVRAHGISPVRFGLLIAINGLLIVFLQPLAGDLTRYRSRRLTLAAASLLLGAGLGMNAWVGSFGGYAVSVTIWTLGEILFAPASQSLVADLAPGHLRGTYQGAFALAFTAAFATAPALGGYILAHAGARWLWLGCLVTGTLVAAGFSSLGERRHSGASDED